MDAPRRGVPGRYPKHALCGDSRTQSSSQGASLEREHNASRSQLRQGSAARSTHRPCEDERKTRRRDRAASSASAGVATSALREQCEITRLLARLLAGITLQWREVMVDLAEGQVPPGISDATAGLMRAAKLSGRTHTRHRHHHHRRSRSPSQRSHSRRAHSAASASYLTEELCFDVEAHDAERARRSSRYRAPLASLPRRSEVHPYNCGGGTSASALKNCLEKTYQEDGGASHTGTGFCSAATNWDRLIPAIQWIPLLLYGDAAVHRDVGTDARRDSSERGVFYASPYPRRSSGHASMGDESGDEGGHVGSDVPSDAQIRRTVLRRAARSAEVMILGMRQVREMLSAVAVVNGVCDPDAHGNTPYPSHRGHHRNADRDGRVSARSDPASRDAGAEWSRASTHSSRQHYRCTAHEERKKQACSATAPLDGARHSSSVPGRHRLRDQERGESSPISFAGTTPPSRSQPRSLRAADSASAAGAALPAPAAGVLVLPAPPPSERLHIYSHARTGGHGEGHSMAGVGSASVAPGASVSPLRHHRYSATTTGGSSAAPPSPHVRRKLEWRATHAATLAGVNPVAMPADESVASAEALVSSIDKSSTSASSTRARLPLMCRPSSMATAAALSTSEAYRTVLVHEEGEARMRIVMTHNCHFVNILRDHYEHLRKLEREWKQQSLATTIEPTTKWASVSVKTARAAASEDVSNFRSSTSSSLSLSTFAASAHAETSSEADMSPSVQMTPTRGRGCNFGGEGVPDEAPPPSSTSTTADTVDKSNKSVLLPPPQRRQPAWKKSSTTASRTSASPSSAATSATSRLPERRLPARHLPSVILGGSCPARALSTLSAAAATPTAPASASESATCPPEQESQQLSPPPVRPSVSAHQLSIAVTVEEVEVECAECTPSVTRQAHTRPSRAASCPLLSPLDEPAKGAAAQDATRDSDSAADCVIPENAEGSVSLDTTTIAAVPRATVDDCASLTVTYRDSSPLPGARVDGAGLDEVEDDVPPGCHSDGATPRHSAVDVELFPVNVAHAKAACAPLPRKPPIISPSPLPLVPGTTAVNGTEVAAAKDDADAVSFSSVSSFHECSVESPIAGEPLDVA